MRRAIRGGSTGLLVATLLSMHSISVWDGWIEFGLFIWLCTLLSLVTGQFEETER